MIQNAQTPMIRTTNKGIIRLLAFSIPFSTPRITITAVSRMKTANQRTGEAASLINPVKNSSPAAFETCPVKKVTRYLITHPPITQ